MLLLLLLVPHVPLLIVPTLMWVSETGYQAETFEAAKRVHAPRQHVA